MMKTIFEHHSFVEYLIDRFQMRVDRNPHYSLRAFARDLKIDASRLSQILKGKQGLSMTFAERICYSLRLSEAESRHFCHLVASRHARSNFARVQAKKALEQDRSYRKELRIAIDPNDIDKAEGLFLEFREKFYSEFERKSPAPGKKQMYFLNIQLFSGVNR